MCPDKFSNSERYAISGSISRADSTFNEALAALARAVDEMASDHPEMMAEKLTQIEMDLGTWIEQSIDVDARRRVPLSSGALDIIASLAPEASLTTTFLEQMDAKRKAARLELDVSERASKQCNSDSPGVLFRKLRLRAGLDVERAATALGITPDSLIAIEKKELPWYQISPSQLPNFATLVREPLRDLVRLIGITAKRLFLYEIMERADVALGRFDQTQQLPSDARISRLRLVFARMREQNRAYAAFLKEAERIAAIGKEETLSDSRRKL